MYKVTMMVVGLICSWVLASPAWATTTAQGTLPVTSNITTACAVTIGGSLAFSATSAVILASGADAQTDFTVTCTNNYGYAVKMNAGLHGTFTSRQMQDASSEPLTYNLYTDAPHSHVWGDGTGATQTVSGTGTGNAQTLTVFGHIDAGQNVKAAAYSDSVTVSIDY